MLKVTFWSQNGPNWALFVMASLYWRVSGETIKIVTVTIDEFLTLYGEWE